MTNGNGKPYYGVLMKDGTEITHYGVKGMKWGKRKKIVGTGTKTTSGPHYPSGLPISEVFKEIQSTTSKSEGIDKEFFNDILKPPPESVLSNDLYEKLTENDKRAVVAYSRALDHIKDSVFNEHGRKLTNEYIEDLRNELENPTFSRYKGERIGVTYVDDSKNSIITEYTSLKEAYTNGKTLIESIKNSQLKGKKTGLLEAAYKKQQKNKK